MTYETPLKITAWHVETDKFRIRRLGKALEEMGELVSVLARCIIQGVDEVDPSSGEVNRMRMQKEGADVYTQLAHLVDAFDLNQSDMLTRIGYKTDSMAEWERLLQKEKPDVGGFSIDNSAGRPILVYEDCSVIEADVAAYVLDLIRADQGSKGMV